MDTPANRAAERAQRLPVREKDGEERRRIETAVETVGEKYRCNVCGNEVMVTEVGGGTLVCCGEDMELLT